ncbi:MAG: zf-HC2 domain-containing protein [Gemmatimonadota bacterium]
MGRGPGDGGASSAAGSGGGHPRERLGAWIDGELAAADSVAVEVHVRGCTECAREAMILRQLGGAMRNATYRGERRSVWEGVHRRITQPMGWVLLVAGAVIWGGLAIYEWWRAEITVEWLAGTAAVIGVALLLVGIGYEQYREWQETRYKDVQL